MGAWGSSAFENDAAGDWIDALREEGNHESIDLTLDAVAQGSTEADDCSAALAAAEVVAAARGWPMRGFPKELKEWIERFDYRPTGETTMQAIEAVQKVGDGSELAELWSENVKQAIKWRAGLDGLLERLRNEPRHRPSSKKPKRPAPADAKRAIQRLKELGAYIQTTLTGQAKYVQTRSDVDDEVLAACLPFVSKTKVLRIGLGGLMATPERLNVTDAAFESLDRFTSLQELSLTHTLITDATPARLTKLTRLRELELTATSVTDAGMEPIRGLILLEKLHLGYTAVTDAGMKYLADLKNLKKLDLIGTAIADQGLQYLTGLENLQQLDLRYTKITGAGLPYLAGLTNLEILELDHTLVDDEGLSHLVNLKKLERLTVRGKRITDEAVKTIGQMTALRGLVLEKSNLTDAALPTLAALPRLEIVHLAGTGITTEGARWLRQTRPKLTVLGKDK